MNDLINIVYRYKWQYRLNNVLREYRDRFIFQDSSHVLFGVMKFGNEFGIVYYPLNYRKIASDISIQNQKYFGYSTFPIPLSKNYW